MALDALRAVRALDMNLKTINQPQQFDLRRETFFSLAMIKV
jgi:hypothetical protein